jgi:hypothetical protein
VVVAAAALLAGWFPIGFSIAIVFLFAGPHNWLEARYFMTRMPARWGRLRGYFTLGIGGVVALAATMIAIPAIAAALGDGRETWLVLLAAWNSALVLWAAALASIRRRQNPRRQWPWLWPTAFLLVSAAWLWPVGWGIGLVYLHPLLALAFLDAEISRWRPDLRQAYRWCLLAVPATPPRSCSRTCSPSAWAKPGTRRRGPPDLWDHSQGGSTMNVLGVSSSATA